MDLRQGRLAAHRQFSALAVMIFMAACGPKESSSDGSGSAAPTQAQESAYCTTRETYPTGVSLTGQALFEYRAMNLNQGLGNPTSAGIPLAEVVVTNAAGAVVQCGETEDDGDIALTIPSTPGTYQVSIRSRSFTSKLRVSVLEDYWANQPYALTASVTVGAQTTSVNMGTVTARARQMDSAKIEGGAFNILYRVWQANEYLRATIGDASFVASKVSIYWKMGHNPYNYFGGTSMLSFYRPGYSQLFILGGDQGDVKTADTDHFDNSVILHEYGHFLEDIYAQSDSPGGSHNGNFMIDPRLAWSEGWANFFQAAVLKHYDSSWRYYLDSYGFKNDTAEGGGGGIAIKFELTMTNGRCASTIPFSLYDCDPVSHAGEGTFREISISRALFKTMNPIVDGGAEIPFSALWSAFAGTDSSGQAVGLASSAVRFRNVARFNQFLRPIIQSSHSSLEGDWDTVLASERQNSNRGDYAAPLVKQSQNSCATTNLAPVKDQESADLLGTNLLRSNDFYEFSYDGGGGTLALNYSGGSNHIDLDLFVYVENHVLQETWESENGTIAARSARAWATDQGSESLSLAGLSAGTYLINVKAYTQDKTTAELSTGSASYRLTFTKNGTTEDLCPAP